MNLQRIFSIPLLIALLFIGIFAQAQQENPDLGGIRYVCTQGSFDLFEYWVNNDEADIAVAAYFTNSAAIYTSAQADVIYRIRFEHLDGQNVNWGELLVGPTLAGISDVTDIECPETTEDQTLAIYGYYGQECGGSTFIVPELAGQFFYVDGNEYTVNADGTISWIVPEEIDWTWDFYTADGILFASILAQDTSCTLTQYPLPVA